MIIHKRECLGVGGGVTGCGSGLWISRPGLASVLMAQLDAYLSVDVTGVLG